MGAIRKIQEFISDSRAVGILLLACTFISLLITNSPLGTALLSKPIRRSRLDHRLPAFTQCC